MLAFCIHRTLAIFSSHRRRSQPAAAMKVDYLGVLVPSSAQVDLDVAAPPTVPQPMPATEGGAPAAVFLGHRQGQVCKKRGTTRARLK